MIKKGVLLINLGTPDHASPSAVYRYLKEFLNDERVIDLSKLGRWLLTNLIIVPFRHRQSARAYQKIWTNAGSPLLVNSLKLTTALAEQLGNHYQVELGMRYGNPSIKSALAKFSHCNELTVIPLFPQYSSAATGSAMASMMNTLMQQWNIPQLRMIRDFYNNPGFIAAYADIIKEKTAGKNIDVILFSYHGLPERHINKSQCQATCNRLAACPAVDSNNLFCYRAQCYRTTELLAQALKLTPGQYQTAFQSRLGRTPWIKPYTDLLLPELREQGIKNMAVVCPSFVADCLETLEEISIRAREQWLNLGGNEFVFIPCVNDHPVWVKAVNDLILTGLN
jgi:ferrochelatase